MLFTEKSDVNNSKTVICLITHILIFTSTSLYTTQSISLISMDNLTSSKRCLRFSKRQFIIYRHWILENLMLMNCLVKQEKEEEGTSSIRNLSLFCENGNLFLYQIYGKMHFLVTLKIKFSKNNIFAYQIIHFVTTLSLRDVRPIHSNLLQGQG